MIPQDDARDNNLENHNRIATRKGFGEGLFLSREEGMGVFLFFFSCQVIMSCLQARPFLFIIILIFLKREKKEKTLRLCRIEDLMTTLTGLVLSY